MTRCTFKQGQYNCGSYAFNLWKENIEQGDYCDHHYWQDQAEKARADEREACAKVCDEASDKALALQSGRQDDLGSIILRHHAVAHQSDAAAIRTRGQAS
jgi:hypothetical protein